jgi:hypothetical protein
LTFIPAPALGLGLSQQMNMVGHQHVRMDPQAVALGRIKQAFLEKLVVVVVPKDWMAVIAPQDDVQWDTFDEIAGETGHIANLAYKSSLTPYM